MMNLSCLSKSIIFSIIAALASAWTLVLVYSGAADQMIAIATSVQFCALLLVLLNLTFVKKFFNKVERVCSDVQIGNFESRLILPNAKGDVKNVADRINSLIDVNDAFVREAALALEAANEGRFYRKIRPEGMQGMHLQAVNRINQAIDIMAQAEKDRVQIIRDLSEQIGGAIDAAIVGDFTKQLHTDQKNSEFSAIAQQVNTLIATVDRGLLETGHVLDALAHTDLSKRVEGNYQGAFRKLKDDTNKVADNLGDVIGKLRQTSHSLKAATGEILDGANDLSQRTLKQAATIEQTSAAMQQLSNTVIDSAKQADEAQLSSKQLSVTAEKSGVVVNQTTEAMLRITESSSKISNVIGMIDDISFQTNLLALNASVEAARAGEAGKGFAVVAVEVRRLAQSAAEASTEVKALVEQSMNEVSNGSEFVREVSENLTDMISSIQLNSERILGLATSSREQATAIEEVNVAVGQMDEMTQHNAALVEETNAAIEQADSQVNELDNIVVVFKLKTDDKDVDSAAVPYLVQVS